MYCVICQGPVLECLFGDTGKFDTRVRVDGYGQNQNLRISEKKADFCCTSYIIAQPEHEYISALLCRESGYGSDMGYLLYGQGSIPGKVKIFSPTPHSIDRT